MNKANRKRCRIKTCNDQIYPPLLFASLIAEFGAVQMKASSTVEPSAHTAVESTVETEDEGGDDGGFPDLPIDVDFDKCTAEGGDGPSANCGFFEMANALAVANSFSTCTGWSLADLIEVVTGSLQSFQDVVEACGGAEGGGDDATPDAGCVAAITELATDDDNPLRPFISDLVSDPQKYCGCNEDFYDSAPTCTITGGIDLGQAKEFSCFFDEICDELSQTCELVEAGVMTCLNNAFLGNEGVTVYNCDLKVRRREVELERSESTAKALRPKSLIHSSLPPPPSPDLSVP